MPEGDGKKQSTLYGNLLFAALVIAILCLTVYFRAPMLHFFGFYEPDGYYHYSVIRAAINNGFVVPTHLGISGWPGHTLIGEPYGLYYVTLVPYYFLRFFDISYYTIMRLLPVFYGLLDVIGAYFLSRYLSKDRLFGLLVMLFVALNMGNAARTSALIYRGDSFVTPFLLASLIFTIEIFRTEDFRKKIAYTLASGFLLALCNLVWNGAPFATATYIFAMALIILFGFVFSNRKMIGNCKYLLIVLLAWYIFVAIFRSAGLIPFEPTFTGLYFFMLFGALLFGWYLTAYLDKDKSPLAALGLDKPYLRFLLAAGFIAAVIAIIYLFIPGLVYQIFIANGFEINGNNFSATIQELQAPTAQFIFASFGLQILTPPGLVVYIFTIFGQYATAFWALMLVALLPYFFMQVYDSKGFDGGSARVNFDFSVTMLVVLSFFALTAYLQMHAIRFNSLVSVPLSIIFAYTVYWLVTYARKRGPWYILPIFFSVLVVSADVLFLVGAISYLVGSPIIIFISLLLVGYWLMMIATKYKTANLTAYFLIILLIAFMVGIDLIYINSLSPADNINPMFISSLSWLKSNAPGSSVVLTLWPDGSVIEGVANLTSVTDSVGSQNSSKANPFAAWLFNSSPDAQFLTSSINGRPDYLLVRSTWLLETGGIYTESNLTTNSSLYGYLPFTSLNEKVGPSSQIFNFFGGGLQAQTIINMTNGTQSLQSFLISNQGESAFTYVAFYDASSGNYSMVRQTAYSQTNNQTFLIEYSDVKNPNLPVNITSAYMLTPGLAQTNMMQFIFFCSKTSCPWNDNNNVASLSLVYVNPDTKIFKITYNSTT